MSSGTKGWKGVKVGFGLTSEVIKMELKEMKERLEALEREVARLKGQNRRLSWGLLTVLTVAVLPYLLAAQRVTLPVVRANRFEVVSEETGKVIATIKGVKVIGGEGLGIFGEGGKAIARLFTNLFGSGSLGICNEKGETVASLSAYTEGGILGIYNKEGKTVAGLSAYPEGGILGIYNKEGKTVAGLFAEPEGGRLNIRNKEEKLVAGLSAYPEGGRLEIHNPRNEKTAAVVLSVAQNGSGFVGTSDAFGRVLWGSPLW